MMSAWSPRRIAITGVAIVAVGYLAMATFAAITLPWIGTGDAFEHLDYVYQVAHGHLPAPIGHLWQPQGFGPDSPSARQFASAHPPLFYAVVALFAAPFFDGTWPIAVILIRGFDILVGLGGLVVLAWVGWMIGGRRKVALAVALPAVGTATHAYLRFSAEVYNDLLVTTLSLLGVALSIKILKDGLTWQRVLILAVVSAAGIGTKATFALTLALALAAIAATPFLHGGGRRRWTAAVAAAAAVVAAPVAAFGWYFLRNAETSGEWYRSTPKSAVGGRVERGILDNLLNPEFYLIVPKGLIGRGTPAFYDVARTSSLVIFLVAVALSIVVVGVFVAKRHVGVSRVGLAIGGLLTMHLVGSYVLQLSHATGYGAYNWRYFLPSTISIALLLCFGAANLGRWSALAVPALVGTLWVFNGASFIDYSVDRAGLPGGTDVLTSIRSLAEANSLPGGLPAVALALAAVSLIGLALVMFRAAAPASTRRGDARSETAPHDLRDDVSLSE